MQCSGFLPFKANVPRALLGFLTLTHTLFLTLRHPNPSSADRKSLRALNFNGGIQSYDALGSKHVVNVKLSKEDVVTNRFISKINILKV